MLCCIVVIGALTTSANWIREECLLLKSSLILIIVITLDDATNEVNSIINKSTRWIEVWMDDIINWGLRWRKLAINYIKFINNTPSVNCRNINEMKLAHSYTSRVSINLSKLHLRSNCCSRAMHSLSCY